MTDAQFNILIAVIGAGLSGIAVAVRWSVNRLTKSLDDNTKAHLESVRAMTEMSVKLDFVYQATGRVDDFIKEEISQTHETPIETPKKRQTPTTYHVRPKTNPPER